MKKFFIVALLLLTGFLLKPSVEEVFVDRDQPKVMSSAKMQDVSKEVAEMQKEAQRFNSINIELACDAYDWTMRWDNLRSRWAILVDGANEKEKLGNPPIDWKESSHFGFGIERNARESVYARMKAKKTFDCPRAKEGGRKLILSLTYDLLEGPWNRGLSEARRIKDFEPHVVRNSYIQAAAHDLKELRRMKPLSRQEDSRYQEILFQITQNLEMPLTEFQDLVGDK